MVPRLGADLLNCDRLLLPADKFKVEKDTILIESPGLFAWVRRFFCCTLNLSPDFMVHINYTYKRKYLRLFYDILKIYDLFTPIKCLCFNSIRI